MATIWVVNEAGHNYEKAKDVATPDSKIDFLTKDDINPHRVDRLSKQLAKGIVSYARADDFLLISGTPMVNALAVWIWMIHFGQCQVLQWDAKHRLYRLTTLDDGHMRSLMQRILEHR